MFWRRFNTERFARRARGLGSPWSRWRAWRQGRADGKIELYGPLAAGGGFAEESPWVMRQQGRATDIQTQAERTVGEWMRVNATDGERYGRELVATEEKIRTILTQSEGAHSKVPRTNHRAKVVFFCMMFLFEFFFSAVALITSGLVSVGFEIAIAVVAAGVLVWLSDIVGTHLRQLPLSHEATTTDRVRHTGVIVLSCVGLAGILVGINFLRSMTNTAADGLATAATPGAAETARQMVQWALFAIGLGLVLTGVFRSGEDEYSGARYGLAQRERQRAKLQGKIAQCEATAGRLAGFPAHLDKLLRLNLAKTFAVYADQYRRQALGRERSIRRA